MKKLLIALVHLPFLTVAQTVVKRQPVSYANPYSQVLPAIPIGFNVKGDTNILFYWSQDVKGTLQDGKKQDRKIGTLINNLFDASKQETITALPLINESVYDTSLKFISVSNKLISTAPLVKGEEYSFNGKSISQDVNDLPAVFAGFPFLVNQYPVTNARLSYTGTGLLGEKNKKYYPIFTGQQFSFTPDASPYYTTGEVPKETAQAATLEGLVAKKKDKLIFLPGAGTAQGIFYSSNDPDKFAASKNYQFVTWDKEGNILNKEVVNLPFAYEPEGVAIINESQQGTGFVYFCQRADVSKKALAPDENSYYIIAFDSNGKLTASFETKLGKDENKVTMITTFSNKGTNYFIAQNKQRKAEKITVYKLTGNIEKVGEFAGGSAGTDMYLMSNNWARVEWRLSKSGSFYFVGQGVERIKMFGLRTETPLAIMFMSISPDFASVAMQKADFTEPAFNVKQLTIDILDEQNGNLNLVVLNPTREIGAAVLGPKVSSKLVICSPGYTIYTYQKNYFYDKASKNLYVASIVQGNHLNGEIIKVKF